MITYLAIILKKVKHFKYLAHKPQGIIKHHMQVLITAESNTILKIARMQSFIH